MADRPLLSILGAVAVAVGTVAALVLAVGRDVHAGAAGLVLVLVCPGVVASTWFGRHRLAVAEWLLLTLGVSLAVTAIAATMLSVTPRGLTRQSYAVVLLLMGAVVFAAWVVWDDGSPGRPSSASGSDRWTWR